MQRQEGENKTQVGKSLENSVKGDKQGELKA